MGESRLITDPCEPGYVLPNGAILLDEKPSTYVRRGENTKETVALAFAPGTHEPFCIWSRSRDHESDLTHTGDYFRSIDRAVEAYKARTS